MSTEQPALSVLYGSETGTARDVAERIAALAHTSGFGRVRWAAIDAVPLETWPSLGGPVIFVCSTTGQGDTPATMQRSWARLLQVDCPPMEGLQYAVFGLGDSTYAKYNFQAKMLHNRLRQLGGSAIVHRGLGDEQDGNSHDEELVPWLVELWPALAEALGKKQQLNDAMPFTKFKLEQQPENEARPVTVAFVPSLRVVATDDGNGSGNEAGGGVVEAHQGLPAGAADTPGVVPLGDLTVTAVQRLTAEDHFQSVVQVDFARPPQHGPDSAKTAWRPTDALGVLPRNPASAVEFFVAQYGDPLVRIEANDAAYTHVPDDVAALIATTATAPRKLSDILRSDFDLAATAPRQLFLALAKVTTDPEELERFTELAVVVPEYDRLCWREKRSVVEVLQDFPHLTANLSLAEVLSTVPRMRPRWYSLASDPKDVATLSLCVALLEFETPMKRVRYGTASHQLCVETAAGDVWRGCLLRRGPGVELPPPDSAASPGDARLLLIGPGTGVAPCRALWHHTASAGIRTVVYTGNRDRAKDFLYGEELASISTAEGSVVAHVKALSRERPAYPHRYVQHAIVASAAEVAAALRDPRTAIFISGNSKRMPQDVHDALVSIVANRVPACEGDAAAAGKYLQRMRLEGRYVTDTWS